MGNNEAALAAMKSDGRLFDGDDDYWYEQKMANPGKWALKVWNREVDGRTWKRLREERGSGLFSLFRSIPEARRSQIRNEVIAKMAAEGLVEPDVRKINREYGMDDDGYGY